MAAAAAGVVPVAECSWIKDLLYEELQLRVYRQEQDDPEAHLHGTGQGQAGRSGAAAGTATIAFRSTGTAAVAAASSAAAAAAAGPSGMRGTASVLLPRAGAGGSFLAPGPARGGKAAAASFLAPRSGPGAGAGQGSAATPQRGAAGGSATGLALGGAGAGAGPAQVSTREVVRCLAQLDGVAEAKAYLRYHTRAQVRAHGSGLLWWGALGPYCWLKPSPAWFSAPAQALPDRQWGSGCDFVSIIN